MNRIPERNRPLVILGASLVVVILVAGGVLLTGQLGPSPSPPPSSSPRPTESPSADPGSSPEPAVRAFLDALIHARRTDDPSLLEPHVTNRQSSAYRTVAAFLEGQREAGKAAITTVLELEAVRVDEMGDTAELTATLLEAGYDIDLATGGPLESPVTLEPRELVVELKRVDGSWKVDTFETRPTGAPS